MIKFDRKDSDVKVHISLDIPGAGSWTYTLDWHASSVPHAQLIVNQLDDMLNEKLKQIREIEYNNGWTDAKAKRKKKEWFAGWW